MPRADSAPSRPVHIYVAYWLVARVEAVPRNYPISTRGRPRGSEWPLAPPEAMYNCTNFENLTLVHTVERRSSESFGGTRVTMFVESIEGAESTEGKA